MSRLRDAQELILYPGFCFCSLSTFCHVVLDTFQSCTPSPRLLSRSWVKVKRRTVKLCYNRLTYNISSVIAYISSQSCHFSIKNVSVSMYMDITCPRLLWTDFWAQTLQQTLASTVCTFVRCHVVFTVDFSQ